MAVTSGTFHATDVNGALEVHPITPRVRELFPETCARYPERVTFIGSWYVRGVLRRRVLMAVDSYPAAMMDARYLIGYPDPADPRALEG